MLTINDIRNFIITEIDPDLEVEDLDEDLDLLGLNIINSLSVLKLVIYFEDKNNISIDLEDIDFDDFKSISSMHKYLLEKHS